MAKAQSLTRVSYLSVNGKNMPAYNTDEKGTLNPKQLGTKHLAFLRNCHPSEITVLLGKTTCNPPKLLLVSVH
jgi:hypothetical protein